MHLAYSALRPEGQQVSLTCTSARYKGYLAACQKHQKTIAAIQQYLPGWQPSFAENGGGVKLVCHAEFISASH